MRRQPQRTEAEPVADKRAVAERRQSNGRIIFGTVITIAVLHLAKPVVVPVALAVMFSFLLTPIVVRLERTFLRRTGAIVLSLGLTTAALGFGGWWIYQQFNAVAAELSTAATSKNVEDKMKVLLSRGGGRFAVFEGWLQKVAAVGDKTERAD